MAFTRARSTRRCEFYVLDCQHMKRILVTGANKGIGFAIANKILADHDDTFVLLGARDADRGKKAVTALNVEYSDERPRAALVEIDVSSDTSVSRATQRVAEKYGANGLFALVNNAGIGHGASGLEAILEVNTRGMHRVCESFLPLIDSQAGRVVNITSASGPTFVSGCSPNRQKQLLDPSEGWAGIQSLIDEALAIESGPQTFEDEGFGSGDAYGFSKALANLYTLVLANENTKLCINACTPGFIETDLTRPYAKAQGKSPSDMGMKSPEQGARSAMFLLLGDPGGSGQYFGSDAVRSPLDRYRAPGDPPYTGN